MAWLAGWRHRKTVTITGETGAGTNYQVNLSIGDASGGDFHLENHCTSFPNDITVTDNDQTTLLDHWVEDLTVDPISMWVEVADDLGSNADIYVYYDKSGESSTSNGGNTFPNLFDHFLGSSLDTAKWDELHSPTISVSGSVVTISRASTAAVLARIQSKTSFGTCALRERVKVSSIEGSAGREWGFSYNTDANPSNQIKWEIYGTVQQVFSKKAGNTEATEIAGILANTFQIYDILFEKNTKSTFYMDGNLKDTDTTYIPNVDLYPDVGIYANFHCHTIYADWVLIRKYQATEPAFASAGGEESAPVAGVGRLICGGLVNDGLVHGRLVA